MKDNEELQSRLNELLGKFPGYSAEIIGDDNETHAKPEMPDDPASMLFNALKGAFKDAAFIEVGCYHYILDSNGDPVHCEDDKKLMEFQRRDGHIMAVDSFFCRYFHCKVKTSLIVHNPMVGDKVPKPQWKTETVNIDTGDVKTSVLAETAASAMQFHRGTCAAMKREIAKINNNKESEASNE